MVFMRNISLVGFMGTGKTTVGKVLAKRLGYTFVDCDDEIEKGQGTTISHIFSEFGEPYFRELEKNMVAKLSARQGLVISAGGGAVMDPANMENMKKGGPVICLSATPEVILKRVERFTHRPLLQVPDPLAKIKELLEARGPFYAKADFTVDTGGLGPDKVVDKIIELVGGKL